MTLWMRDDLANAWEKRDPFAAVAAVEGEEYRNVSGRRTVKFTLNGRHYFLKHHQGVGWREIIKNLSQLRAPITSARNEWRAIEALQALSVPTMTLAAYGARGRNPARTESFVITDALEQTISLEDLCADWSQRPPSPVLKRALLREVAIMARRMHRGGVCHRDFYICHFLLRTTGDGRIDQNSSPRLFLIDLHRALIKKRLPRRWMAKDLAGLLFSSRDIGLTKADRLRFVSAYHDMPLRECLASHSVLWSAVMRKSRRVWEREGRRLRRHITRPGAQFARVSDARQLVLYRRDRAGPSLGRLLGDPDALMAAGESIKDGDTTTVVALDLDGQRYVAKRYNILGFWHGVKRLAGPSRAWRCWCMAHQLLEMGLKTPLPVMMLEKRVGMLRREAYYVTDYEPGDDVLRMLAGQPADSADWQRVIRQFHDLFTVMRRQQLVHGDMKATNFISRPDGLVILDLDAALQITHHRRFQQRFNKDLKRFLKNWQDDATVRPQLESLLAEFGLHDTKQGR